LVLHPSLERLTRRPGPDAGRRSESSLSAAAHRDYALTVSSRARKSGLWLLAVALGLAYAAVAVLVSAGVFDRIDSYAAWHLMPGLHVRHDPSSLLDDLLPHHGSGFSVGDAIRLPAGFLVSALLVVCAAAYLWRRGRRWAAWAWLALFAVACAVEVMCKGLLTRPSIDVPVRGSVVPISGFDSSYPSGHLLRAAVLAALAAYLWSAWTPAALAWLAVVAVTLEVDGRHTPSDLLGAALLASCLIASTLGVLGGDAPVVSGTAPGAAAYPVPSARDG
jgi:membrane-associated phospholipid phosphatase